MRDIPMTIKRCPKCSILFGPTSIVCNRCGSKLEIAKGPKLRYEQ